MNNQPSPTLWFIAAFFWTLLMGVTLDIFPMTLYSGVIYGLVLYGVGLTVWLLRRRGQQAAPATAQTRQGRATTAHFDNNRRPTHPAAAPAPTDAVARMERLKELRAANLITEAEFQQKRSDILKDV